MFKSLCLLLAFLASTALYANYTESITHNIKRDHIVQKGVVHLRTKNITTDNFTLELAYNIKVKYMFFSKIMTGTKEVILPTEFLTEDGYRRLEQERVFRDSQMVIKYIRRIDLTNYYDCHVVDITPRRNPTFSGTFTYCPGVSSIGFAKTTIRLKQVPVVGRHTINTVLR